MKPDAPSSANKPDVDADSAVPALKRAERRLFAQAWSLRQLMPHEAQRAVGENMAAAASPLSRTPLGRTVLLQGALWTEFLCGALRSARSTIESSESDDPALDLAEVDHRIIAF